MGNFKKGGDFDMYIPEFVCGIGVTVIAEILLLVTYGVYVTINNRKRK